MHNVKLIIAYDGTDYLGWQNTNVGKSIERDLQIILERILQHPIHLQAASRTDKGVHAAGQVVNFLTFRETLNLPQLQLSLNSLLPKSIAILNIECMLPSFHPTLDCTGKEYRYYICNTPVQLPQHRFYSWHCPSPLQLDLMLEAAMYLIGQHDFSAFCNVRKQMNYENCIRQINSVDINRNDEGRLCIKVAGNHFLYKMVRNIVGTLVYVGKGKIEADSIPGILNTKDRSLAGVTAPAHGLFLHKVYYPCEA